MNQLEKEALKHRIVLSNLNPNDKTRLQKLVNQGERRRSKWVSNDTGYYWCFLCGCKNLKRGCMTEYCPQCGAVMGDGGDLQ